MRIIAQDIANMIDHSLLRPELTLKDVLHGCSIAKKYSVASVCCRPSDIDICANALAGTQVTVSTVIGFPHGAVTTDIKVLEAEQAIGNGATELDMVINIGRLRSGDSHYVTNDIDAVCELAHSLGAIVKVIFENCYLSNEEKILACMCCESAGVDYIKTSTGFGIGGATIDDIRLMRSHIPDTIKIKAAGGVRTLDTLLSYIPLGVSRFGATATIDIMEEALTKELEGTLFV